MIRALLAFVTIFFALFPGREITAADDAASTPSDAEVKRLMATLKEGQVHASAIPGVVAAINKAGELKLCAAVPELVKLLTLRDPAVDELDQIKEDLFIPHPSRWQTSVHVLCLPWWR
jgi:hypothetical protein